VLAAYAALDPLADAIIVDNYDVSIEPTDGDANTGEGVIEAQTTVATTTGGTSVLSGIDTNPVVTRGIFTALMQLQIALEDNDLELMERAIELLDGSSNELSYRRAELGAEQQTMELLSTRLDLENVELRSTLAIEYDVDMAAAVSNYHGRQAAYEASLQTTANISRMSLLSYL